MLSSRTLSLSLTAWQKPCLSETLKLCLSPLPAEHFPKSLTHIYKWKLQPDCEQDPSKEMLYVINETLFAEPSSGSWFPCPPNWHVTGGNWGPRLEERRCARQLHRAALKQLSVALAGSYRNGCSPTRHNLPKPHTNLEQNDCWPRPQAGGNTRLLHKGSVSPGSLSGHFEMKKASRAATLPCL